MSLRQKIYEKLLSDFRDEVLRDPDADVTPSIQKLAAVFTNWENKRAKDAINTLLIGLNDGDTQALRQDITKVIVLGTAKAAPAQRGAIFRNLCEELSLHTKEDFSDILANCDRIEASRAEDEEA